MKSPLLTIIIPVFNASHSITTITSSVLSGKLQDFELILVDDGSIDDTVNVLRGVKKSDPRIIIQSKKNGGPSSARNAGLKKARGKYTMFLDADDDIDSDMLAAVVQAMEKTNSDLVASGWQIDLMRNDQLFKAYKQISPVPTQIRGNPLEMKKYVIRSIGTNGQLYNLWNKLFRTDIIHNHDLRFREDIHFGEDLIFTFHYLEYVKQLNLIPEPFYHYRANSETSVFSKSALVSEYRDINSKELEKFVGSERDQELDDLFWWVKWRWLLSYARIIAGAPISRREKLQLIKSACRDQLVVARTNHYIGTKKRFIEQVFKLVTHSTRLTLLTTQLIHFSREIVIKLKTVGSK